MIADLDQKAAASTATELDPAGGPALDVATDVANEDQVNAGGDKAIAKFAGGSLALSRFDRHRLAATRPGSIAGAIAVFALLGYLTGIDTLYGSVSVNSPTLPATVGLLCVAAGIIFWIGTMPVFRKSRPLWHLLALLGCAIVAPLLLFGVYAGFRITDAQLCDVRENLAIEARTLSANVDREIIGEIERLQPLAASPSLRQLRRRRVPAPNRGLARLASKRQHRAHRSQHAATRQYPGAVCQPIGSSFAATRRARAS